MSSDNCWECGEDYPRDEMFDIPVFNKGWTIKWCFGCASKQLKCVDKIIINKDEYKPITREKKLREELTETKEELEHLEDEHAMVCAELQRLRKKLREMKKK